MSGAARVGVVLLALALAGALIAAILGLPEAGRELPSAVAANLSASGVEHPVTAVLLNFRGYDTLLEVAVLLLALMAMLAALHREVPATAPPPGDPVLHALARLVVPLMILAAGYLLWAGAHRPGGAFQAGAVLAGAAVLLYLAGLLPAWASPRFLLRVGLAGGFLVFLILAVGLVPEGGLLRYPPEQAGSLILLIEASLTVSLGLILAGLFLVLAAHPAPAEGRAGGGSKS